MAIKYIAKCDLCGKEEESVNMDGFPNHWTCAQLKVSDTKYPNQKLKTLEFHLCTTCYEPNHSLSDFKPETLTPSTGAKNLLKKLLTFVKQ